jgi:hypothetical protein
MRMRHLPARNGDEAAARLLGAAETIIDLIR